MSFIKKIINYIISIFKMLFKKDIKEKKIRNDKNINLSKNKTLLKGYGLFIEDAYNETLPIYLLINNIEKERLVEKAKCIETKILEKESNDNEYLIDKIEEIIDIILDNNIYLVENEKIEEKIDNIINDKEVESNAIYKINELNDDIYSIVKKYDKNLRNRIIKEYEKVNYVTISMTILDDTIQELEKLENNYAHHRFNKRYYDKELAKIKDRIDNLRKIRDSEKIQKEIEYLRSKIDIKSIDKYDLLYNDEIFTNVSKTCDDLLFKVNRKVIDVKKEENKKLIKEPKEEKKEDIEEEKKKEEWEDNILKRFQDLEISRRVLLLNKKEKIDSSIFNNKNDVLKFMQNSYNEFLIGENDIFNFERNKAKTEIVKLYNNLSYLNALIVKEDSFLITHINYKMDDLVNVTMNKKDELEKTLEDRKICDKEDIKESSLVDSKLESLYSNEVNKEKTKPDERVKTLVYEKKNKD